MIKNYKIVDIFYDSVAYNEILLNLIAECVAKFSADEIFERVWKQESIVSAKTVMVHVSHLRDKIEEATGGEKVIQTVWGVGYKIDAR